MKYFVIVENDYRVIEKRKFRDLKSASEYADRAEIMYANDPDVVVRVELKVK